MNERLRGELEKAIGKATGEAAGIQAAVPVGGGSIHQAYRVQLSDGRDFFCKISREKGEDMLAAELEGLQALRSSAAIKTVQPLAAGFVPGSGEEFLITTFVTAGRPGSGFFETFGRSLARLHKDLRGQSFGFRRDNYIGRTPQSNAWCESWISFWREQRLGFQLRLARDNGFGDSRLENGGDELMSRLDELLEGASEGPSLIHGDLWSGNFLVDTEGETVLIDPAVYYADREAELGMCRLFGGFPESFYAAYRETWPLQSGARRRIRVYQLYHLLNHLNLFGRSYLPGCLDLLRNILT